MTDDSAPQTFRCENCGKELEKGWADELAHHEAVRQWGRRGDEPGMAVVCDDCYREIMTWWKEQRSKP
jgi:hypothetical protein